MLKKRKLLRIFGVSLVIFSLFFSLQVSAKTNLKVFHAGSLSVPFKKLEKKFEASHPEVDVQLEAHGSVVAVRQVTELGERGDVVAVADYTLIPSMMSPDYSDFYLQFAQNRMVVAYTEESKLSDKVNSDNWYNVLADPEVRYGFSNPNMDPCGYRSPMVMQLAELHYHDFEILEELLISRSNITVKQKGDKYRISAPEFLNPDTSELSVRPKSVNLVSMLQGGGLDYAFEYMSVAKQHGLEFVTLPRAIDLSSTQYSEAYGRVSVKTSDGNVKKAKPIVYGVTVPTNARHPKLAREFVRFIISDQGKKVFSELGQPPIVPARAFGEVPSEFEDLVEVKS